MKPTLTEKVAKINPPIVGPNNHTELPSQIRGAHFCSRKIPAADQSRQHGIHGWDVENHFSSTTAKSAATR
jgi:hypothetical protein